MMADELDELEGQADELERGSVAEGQCDELACRPSRPCGLCHELDGQESGEQVPADHRPRTDPYPDELGQLYCEACETLCSPGRPCHCCWVEQLCQEDGDG